MPTVLRPLHLLLVGILVLLGPRAWAQSWRTTPPEVVLREEAPQVPEGWDRVSAPFLEVYGAPRDAAVLLELSRHGSARVLELATQLQVPVGGTTHVVVAPTQQAFQSLQPGRIPEWADGTAFPDRGQIFLRRPGIRGPGAKPLEQVLDHELVHVLLGRAFAPGRPPHWLQEGLAQVFAGEVTPDAAQQLARGLAGGRLHSLEDLSHGFPRDPLRAQLAYAQSADFIAWLRETYGEASLAVLVQEMSRGQSVHLAVRAATGQPLYDVDRAWRARLARSGLSLAAIPPDQLLFGLVGLGAVVGLVLARRRQQERLRAMAEEEARQDAWLEALWRPEDPAG